ncbi:cytochrome P450 [Nemania sp. FL0916]|nr:cytochrome P450 [Nemania sp. FL0916]
MVTSGYAKYRDRPFILRRCDADYVVLPLRCLEELKSVPEHKLSPTIAHAKNSGHKWTGGDIFAESHLHVRAIQVKLASELPKSIDIAKAELDYAWPLRIPDSREWQEFDIQPAIRKLVSQLSAKVFVGYPACRDEEWLDLSASFTMDALETAFSIRMFPGFLHPVIASLLPANYRVAKTVRTARRILEPLVKKNKDRNRRRAAGEKVEEEEEDNTLLNWTIANGSDEENRLDKTVLRQLFLTVVSIHTTTSVATNAIFDLCAHPEWVPVLREEIESVTNELGPIGSAPEVRVTQWLQRLETLDSFIIESQRTNPILLLGPQREVMEPLTLEDGTYIPRGARICWISPKLLANESSSITTPGPGSKPSSEAAAAAFDPLRSYAKRHASPDQMNKHLAVHTSLDNLNFGYGKLACPGRHFAVNEVKMLLVRFVTEHDFRFTDRVGPRMLDLDEFTFPDPKVKVMIRRRQDREEEEKGA